MAGAEPTAKKRSDLPVRVASAVVMVAVAGTAFWLGGWVLIDFIILIGLGIFAEWTMLVLTFEHRLAWRALWLLAGVCYIGMAIRAALDLDEALLICVALVVAVDVGAYFAGRTFGGPKIAPKVSPSKTWSGLGGGIAAAFALLWLGNRTYGDGVPGIPVLLAVPVAVIAQSGDFFESWMKRRAGVKDSGRLIPGHGGLFDRADGLMAVLFVIGVFGLITKGIDGHSSPLPFRGGAGGGASPLGSARGDRPHPNPRSEARDSDRPEGEGLYKVRAVHFGLIAAMAG